MHSVGSSKSTDSELTDEDIFSFYRIKIRSFVVTETFHQCVISAQ
jgi:hypothetical protein